MKRGIKKALNLAWKMMVWLEKQEGGDPSISVSNDNVRVYGYPKSFKTIHKFKKSFKGKYKFERKSYQDTMDYNAELIDMPLSILLHQVKELPPSCKIVYKQVEVPERYIEGYVEKAHTEKQAKIVCN